MAWRQWLEGIHMRRQVRGAKGLLLDYPDLSSVRMISVDGIVRTHVEQPLYRLSGESTTIFLFTVGLVEGLPIKHNCFMRSFTIENI